MKIVFFGSSEAAVPSLRAIAASGHTVSLVVTQPDRKKGRHLHISPSPVKNTAISLGIPVYQPERASSSESIRRLASVEPDLFVVVSFGQILSEEALVLPRKYSLNIHSSLLPRYRGAAPVNWALVNGDTETGITIIRMTPAMDAGDIVLAERSPIRPDDTSQTLTRRLSEIGSRSITRAIALIEENGLTFTPQDERSVSFAPKLKKSDGLIDWKMPAERIANRVRGLQPWPGAFTYHDGKLLKILSVSASDMQGPSTIRPGQIVGIIGGEKVAVKTGTADLLITSLQLEGKKALDAGAFLRGHPIHAGDVLG